MDVRYTVNSNKESESLDSSVPLELALLNIKRPLNQLSEIDFKPSHTINVGVGEYAVAQYDSRKPILGSYGAGSCLIVAIYNGNTKRAALAHIAIGLQANFISQMIEEVGGSIGAVAHLVGGSLYSINSMTMCLNIYNLLQVYKVKICNSDIIHGKRDSFDLKDSASLAINAKTGQVYVVQPCDLTPEVKHNTGHAMFNLVRSVESWVDNVTNTQRIHVML